MVPDDMVTYVLTVIVPALILNESHSTGFMVNVVFVVPTVLNMVVLDVVASPVFTGSTRSRDCEGSERYNCLITMFELVVTVCVTVFGPPQPAALAVITVVPYHSAGYVTSPVAAL